MNFFTKIRKIPIINAINIFIQSEYMLIFLALFTVLSNFFGIEPVFYAFAILLGVYLCVFGKDMLVLGPLVIFLYISPSRGNNVFQNSNAIFFPENGLLFLIAGMALFVVLFFVRIGFEVGFHSFFCANRKLLSGILMLGVVFFLGGAGYEGYDDRNLIYDGLLLASFLVLYFILTGAVQWKDVPKDYFAKAGLCIGFSVAAELLFVYLTAGVVNKGIIDRVRIYTGWGMYNNMGAILATCMPCAFYLASVRKNGWIFNVLGQILFGCIFFTNSRGSILVGIFIYFLCILPIFRKGNERQNILNAIVYIICFVAMGFVFFCWRENIVSLFSRILKTKIEGDGRIALYKDALGHFKEYFLFGRGFFACPQKYYNPGGVTFLPFFWHNTFLQMIAACGLAGLIAYLFHRYQTIKMFIVRPNHEKVYLAFCVAAILFTSLIDCHLFNIGIGFLYSLLLAFAEKSEETERNVFLESVKLFQRATKKD